MGGSYKNGVPPDLSEINKMVRILAVPHFRKPPYSYVPSRVYYPHGAFLCKVIFGEYFTMVPWCRWDMLFCYFVVIVIPQVIPYRGYFAGWTGTSNWVCLNFQDTPKSSQNPVINLINHYNPNKRWPFWEVSAAFSDVPKCQWLWQVKTVLTILNLSKIVDGSAMGSYRFGPTCEFFLCSSMLDVG